MSLGLDGDSRDEPAERRGLLGLAGVGRVCEQRRAAVEGLGRGCEEDIKD